MKSIVTPQMILSATLVRNNTLGLTWTVALPAILEAALAHVVADLEKLASEWEADADTIKNRPGVSPHEEAVLRQCARELRVRVGQGQ